MYKKLPLEKYYRLINAGPCVLITSGTYEKPNIAPIAWTMPLNDEPPLVAIAVASTHHTAKLISNSAEFVINIVNKDMLPFVERTGKVSGAKKNKFDLFKIEKNKSSKVSTPGIKNACGHIECRLIDSTEYDGVMLFVGKVLLAEVKKELFDDYWITEKANIIHHLGGSVFACLDKRILARS